MQELNKNISFKGKRVQFRLYGSGKNKFFFYHGFPGSSIQGRFALPVVTGLDASVCAFDRPGYGKSDHCHDFSVGDARDLVGELARSLGWDRYHHFAVSGGTPYALSAARSPLTASCSLVGPLGPMSEGSLWREFHWITRGLMKTASLTPAAVLNGPVRLWQKFFDRDLEGNLRRSPILSDKDKSALLDPYARDVIAASVREAFQQGARGPQKDIVRFRGDWGLDFNEISAPVFIWHGKEDKVISPVHAAYLNSKIPGSVLFMRQDEGHYSLPILNALEIAAHALAAQ